MTGRKSLVILLLLLYWAVSLRHLTIVPPVYEDEPWQASTGWKLATEGVFGTDVFAGFYGMENHYYGYMPLHPFLLAIVFKLGGLGLFQDRFEPVALGLLTLALTYGLGKRLFRPEVGLLAVLFLLIFRTTGVTPSQVSGILFLDISRISRYDMLVPVFGLAGLHVYWSASVRELGINRRIFLYGLAGFLTALAGLSHLYGVFWFAALVVLALWQGSGRNAFLALVIGFILPWLPYLAYVLGAPADWVGQTRDYTPRFELFNWRWYMSNLINEARRYGPGLGTPGWMWLFRPGFWAFIFLLPFSLLALGWRAFHRDRAAATLFGPTVLLPLLFALLIYLKLANYLVTIWPLFALTIAWGVWQIWARTTIKFQTQDHRSKVVGTLRVGLLLFLFLIAAEGALRIYRLEDFAKENTSHDEFMAEVRAHIPTGSRILGLHHYWLGLADHDYRSWAVPLLQIDPHYWSPAQTVAQALDSVNPEVILIDRRMTAYMSERPVVTAAIREWMASQGFELKGIVDDQTYGRMEIYLLPEHHNEEP